MHEARSETFHTGVTNCAQAEQTLTQNRFRPIEEGDRFEPELGPSSERDEAPIASPKAHPQSKQHPVGSGDEPLRPPNTDESQMSFLLQALVRQIGQQGESHTKAMTECMTGTVSMLKETFESVKECLKSVADTTQLNFQQFASSTHNSFEQLVSSTQTSFQQILAEVRAMNLSANNSTQFITAPSTTYIPDVQISTTNSQSNSTCAKHQNVRLPPFAGNSKDSWKVWHARFTTVANLNKWDETTRLSELMQRCWTVGQGPGSKKE